MLIELTSFRLITAFPRYTKYSAYAGFLISTIGFITSGFATEVKHYIYLPAIPDLSAPC